MQSCLNHLKTLFRKFKGQDMVLIKVSETVGIPPIKPKVDCQASSVVRQ